MLWYDEQEIYFADSAATMTDNHVPGGGNALWRGEGLIAHSNPEFAAPRLSLDFLGRAYPAGIPYPSDGEASADDYIDARDAYQEDSARLHANPTYRDRAYGRAIRDRAGRLWLQYWLWYYFNPQNAGIVGTGTHEGDWELVQFRVDETIGRPDLATYARHGSEHETCPWSQVAKVAVSGGDVPVVYVANGSHASYFRAGSYDRPLPLPSDEANGNGYSARPLVEGLPPTATSAPEHWIAWPGRWGATEPGTFGATIGEANSPPGPAFQGQRWNDPLAFSQSGKACEAVAEETLAQPQDTSARVSSGAPPRPRIRAERIGNRVIVRFVVPHAAGRRRPQAIFVTVHPSGRHVTPSGRTVRLQHRRGEMSVDIPAAGRGPYEVRAGAFNGRGERSEIAHTTIP